MATLTSMNKGYLIDQVILTMADNQRFNRSLEQVSAGEVRCDPILRELAQAVLEEIHRARKARKIALWIGSGCAVFMIIAVCVILARIPRH